MIQGIDGSECQESRLSPAILPLFFKGVAAAAHVGLVGFDPQRCKRSRGVREGALCVAALRAKILRRVRVRRGRNPLLAVHGVSSLIGVVGVIRGLGLGGLGLGGSLGGGRCVEGHVTHLLSQSVSMFSQSKRNSSTYASGALLIHEGRAFYRIRGRSLT